MTDKILVTTLSGRALLSITEKKHGMKIPKSTTERLAEYIIQVKSSSDWAKMDPDTADLTSSMLHRLTASNSHELSIFQISHKTLLMLSSVTSAAILWCAKPSLLCVSGVTADSIMWKLITAPERKYKFKEWQGK